MASGEESFAAKITGGTWLRPGPGLMLVGTVLLAAIYTLYSGRSEGFYQHDEAAHFLNMLDFWRRPSLILDSWAKPGYKIIFVLPALLGHRAVILLQCFIAASACYLAARLADILGSPRPALSFLLLAFQPLWLQLSFRSYSEILTAVVLLSALIMHHRQRTCAAALLLSYAVTIRQEMLILAALYAIWLAYKKRLAPVLLLLAFPLLLQLWGSWVTRDPFYLWNTSRAYGAETLRMYPRMGFEHYFLMTPVIFGHIALALTFVYLILVLLKRVRPESSLLVIAGGYFLMHSLLNVQAFPVGAATGGNLRYMIVIAPLLAILGNLAADSVLAMQPRRPLLPFLIAYAAFVGLFCTFRHSNWIYLLDQRDWTPLILALLSCAGIYGLQTERRLVWFVAACSLLFAPLSIRPIVLSPEDGVARMAASWIREAGLADGDLLYSHALVRYFFLLEAGARSGRWHALDLSTLDAAPRGTCVLWDSHYSNRPKSPEHSVPLESLTADPQRYRPLHSFRSEDGRFTLFVFQKESP